MLRRLARAARRLWPRDAAHVELEQLRAERDALASSYAAFKTWVPPGHFYSPIPALSEVRDREARLFASPPPVLPAVSLNEAGQLELFNRLVPYYAELPWGDEPRPGLRYRFDNPAFSYADAIFLYSMIRHCRPRRIIEVGSGHSSCVTLDTNELFFGHRIACTFVEPYPELLGSLLTPADRERIEILPVPVQDVPLARFAALGAGDILFVDSTHVSKVGSDVNHLVFEVLPCLAPGVRVHFHDVFYPFEYPREWVYEGRAWNEAYVLRAFLQYNGAFEISLFNTWLAHAHGDRVFAAMPLCRRNPGGSLWLTKL